MQHILEYELYNDISELHDIISESNLSYDEVIIFLTEDCGFTNEELNIFFTMNEGERWDKFKAGASNLKAKIGVAASNAKDKLGDAAGYTKDKFSNGLQHIKNGINRAKETKYNLQDKYYRAKELGSNIKDHIARNKYKYAGAALAATSGLGLMAAPFLVGAGHLADRYPND